DQPRFRRPPARAAVAAIAQRNQPAAVGGQRAEAIDPPAQRGAVAVEIEEYRLVAARRHVPDDDAPPAGAVEHDLLPPPPARPPPPRAGALPGKFKPSLPPA